MCVCVCVCVCSRWVIVGESGLSCLTRSSQPVGRGLGGDTENLLVLPGTVTVVVGEEVVVVVVDLHFKRQT